MTKFGAIVLAIMMIAMVGLAYAAGDDTGNTNTSNAPTLNDGDHDGEAGTWVKKDTPIVQNRAINIKKEIRAFNANATTVNTPVVTYTYTVTPATVSNSYSITDQGTDHVSGTAVLAPVKAGLTEGLVVKGTAAGTAGNQTKAEGTLVFTNTNTWTTSADGTGTGINNYNINLSFANVAFTQPGVYRYQIEETISPAYAAAAMQDGGSNIRYLDVYVAGNDSDSDGKLDIYGYVCMTANGSVTSNTTKTNGFTQESGNTIGTNSGADYYYTYDLTLSKDVVNDNWAESNVAFPFTVIFNNTENYSSTFTIAETAASGSTGISPTASSAPTWSGVARVKDGASITYTGIPCGVDVDVYETNIVEGVTYTVETSVNGGTASTGVYQKDNNVSWETSATAPTSAVAQTTRKAYESTKKTVDTAIITSIASTQTFAITNTLLQISPTGVMLRVAPYLLMLAGGIALFIIFAVKHRKHIAEEE